MTISNLSQAIRFLVDNDFLTNVELRPGQAQEKKIRRRKRSEEKRLHTTTEQRRPSCWRLDFDGLGRSRLIWFSAHLVLNLTVKGMEDFFVIDDRVRSCPVARVWLVVLNRRRLAVCADR